MKIFFYVLTGIALLLFLLLSRKLFFIFHFDGNLKISAKLLFIKRDIYIPILYRPKDSKDKEDTKKTNEAKDKDLQGLKQKKKQKSKEDIPFPGIKNSIIFFKDSFQSFFGKIIKYFRLEKFLFKAVAASDDAAKTAELYGVFCTVGAAIHQFSLKAKKIKEKNVCVEVIPDFNTQSPDVYVHLVFSIHLWKLFMIAGKALSIWQNYKKLSESTQAERNNSQKQNENNKSEA